MDLWESGLIRYWVNERVPKADECYRSSDKIQKVSTREVPIHLHDLTSAFLILGIGIGLAALSFLLELFYPRFAHCSIWNTVENIQ